MVGLGVWKRTDDCAATESRRFCDGGKSVDSVSGGFLVGYVFLGSREHGSTVGREVLNVIQRSRR